MILCFLIALLIFILIVYLLGKRPEKGALQITSTPNSKVYINDKLIGQTPLCECEGNKMLGVGDYTIRLVPISGNFEPFQRRITITSKVLTVVDRTFSQTALAQASIISLTEIADKTDAQISVISFPDRANVYLDSNLVGQTPTLLKNVTESDHEIKVTRDGYKEKVIRIRTVLGYRLDALIYLGIDPNIATASATLISSPSAIFSKSSVLILDTPTGFLRVREKPSLAGAEVSQVKPSETYELVSEQTGWYEIKLKNDKTGWISSQYAKKQS